MLIIRKLKSQVLTFVFYRGINKISFNPTDLQVVEGGASLTGFNVLREFYGLDPMAQEDSLYTEQAEFIEIPTVMNTRTRLCTVRLKIMQRETSEK